MSAPTQGSADLGRFAPEVRLLGGTVALSGPGNVSPQILRPGDTRPRSASPCVVFDGLMASAGSVGAYNGRSCATLARSTDEECAHPIRSAITVAGIEGNSASSARILGS